MMTNIIPPIAPPPAPEEAPTAITAIMNRMNMMQYNTSDIPLSTTQNRRYPGLS